MNRLIYITFFISTFLFGNECNEYFDKSKFYKAPEFLESVIQKNIIEKNLEIFGTKTSYEKLKLQFKNNQYINEYTVLGDYKYPKQNGIFEYKILNDKIYEFSISQVEIYKYKQSEIANDINSSFDEFWNDWIENAYEMQLIPEQTLFYYKDKYFAFSVFIYGVKGDGTKLNSTIVKYKFRDYSNEVYKTIECNNLKNL